MFNLMDHHPLQQITLSKPENSLMLPISLIHSSFVF